MICHYIKYLCSPSSTNDSLIKYGVYSFEYQFLFRLLTFTNKLVFSLNNNFKDPKALTDLLMPNIVKQGPTDSTLADHNLRNKGDLDEATSLSRFGDISFGFIFPKFINHRRLNRWKLPSVYCLLITDHWKLPSLCFADLVITIEVEVSETENSNSPYDCP